LSALIKSTGLRDNNADYGHSPADEESRSPHIRFDIVTLASEIPSGFSRWSFKFDLTMPLTPPRYHRALADGVSDLT